MGYLYVAMKFPEYFYVICGVEKFRSLKICVKFPEVQDKDASVIRRVPYGLLRAAFARLRL